MSRRLGVAMALLAAALLLVLALGAVHALREADERSAVSASTTLGRSYARELRTRLAASELVVQTVTSDDAGAGGAQLRARILRSDMFRGVVVALAGKTQGPVPIYAADALALSAGQTLLRERASRGNSAPIYLVHAVRASGNTATAYFELNADWLWQGHDDATAQSAVYAVLDGTGTLLRASDDLPADLLSMFAREHASAAEPQAMAELRS